MAAANAAKRCAELIRAAEEKHELHGANTPPVPGKRPSARAQRTMTLAVRCAPQDMQKWARAAEVMDTTLEEVAREAWNRLYVEMQEEEKKVKRWSKR